MTNTPLQDDYTQVIPEFIDKNPFDITLKQVVWLVCCVVIVVVSAILGLWIPAIAAAIAATFAWQTYEGVVFERLIELPRNRKSRKMERSGVPFFEPPDNDEVVQIDEGAKDARGKRASRERDYSTPFTSRPIGLTVPYFGSVPRGVLYDPATGADEFKIEFRGWDLTNLDLDTRSDREEAFANVLKEVLSQLDGGIEFKLVCGSRPRDIYPYAHERMLKTRQSIIETVESLEDAPVDPEQQSISEKEAELLEELLATERAQTVDPVQVISFKVPRPASWARALRKRGYLTESDIENSPLALVMKAAYEGLRALEVTEVRVLDMPSMLTRIRRNLDIGGIDEFLREMHFASLMNEGEGVPWHELFKNLRLWPHRLPRVGKNYVLTDQTLHRIVRLYRFRIRRVLPGFMRPLQMLSDSDRRWWFAFAYVGKSTSASRESQWLERQIVTREGLRRVFRSGDRHESLEEQEHRMLPQQQQDDLYLSRGSAVKSNRYMVISVPLPPLSDDMDEAEQLEEGLRMMRLAESQLHATLRRMRIIPRVVTWQRQLERLSQTLV
jgi:hypothetical protein